MKKVTKPSPELVREVTNKVIALWQRDLRSLAERSPRPVYTRRER